MTQTERHPAASDLRSGSKRGPKKPSRWLPSIWGRGALVVAFACSLASPAVAQGDWLGTLTNQGLGLNGDLTLSDTGQFTADLDPDFVTLRGNIPVVLASPSIYDVRLSFPSGSATPDLAVWRRDVSTGARDSILTIGSTGLLSWNRDAGTESFVSSPLGSASWIGVNRLACFNSDLPESRVIVGTIESPPTMVVLRGPGTPSESEATYSLARPAAELELFQRDLLTVQAALITSLGVLVYDLDTGLFQQHFGGGNDGLLVATRSNAAQDDVSWIRSTGTGQELVLIANSGVNLTAQPAVDLGAIGVVGATAGDVDDDGDADLLFTHQASYLALLYTNAQGTFDTVPPREVPLGPNGPAFGNLAHPVICDFDLDGDLDLGFAAEGDRSFYLLYSALLSASEKAPIPRELQMEHLHCFASEEGRLILKFDDQPIEKRPAGVTDVEILVRAYDSDTRITSSVVLDRFFVPAPNESYEATFLFPAQSFLFDPVYVWTCRYIQRDASGLVVATHPALSRAVFSTVGAAIDTVDDWWGYTGAASWYQRANMIGDGCPPTGVAPGSPGDGDDELPSVDASTMIMYAEDDNTVDIDVKPIPEGEDDKDPNSDGGGN